jgi:hypothetical protein
MAVTPKSLCDNSFHRERTVGRMNLVESIQRGINWLATPHRLEPRLDMETRPIRPTPLEMEIVFCTISSGSAALKFPMSMLILPTGASPVRN